MQARLSNGLLRTAIPLAGSDLQLGRLLHVGPARHCQARASHSSSRSGWSILFRAESIGRLPCLHNVSCFIVGKERR